MGTVEDKVRAWSAPFLLTVAAGMGLMLWNNQQAIISSMQARITSMEAEQSNSRSTLAVIADNQATARDDRADFQQSVTQRLDRMEDVLTQVGQTLAALAAIHDADQPPHRAADTFRQDVETSAPSSRW